MRTCNKPCEDIPTPEEALSLKLIDAVFSEDVEEKLPAAIRDIVRQTQDECEKLIHRANPEDLMAAIGSRQ